MGAELFSRAGDERRPKEQLPPGFEYSGDGVVVCCSAIAKADYGQLRVLRERMDELLRAQVVIGTSFMAMFRGQDGMESKVGHVGVNECRD